MREPVRDPQTIPTPEAQPQVEEMQVLAQTEGGRSLDDATHETALQQVRQLRNHLEAQQKHLESSRGTLRKLFEQVRGWWKKEEGLETAVARLAIEMDHVEDKIKQATPEQLNKHLQPELTRLQQQIEKIQLASVEVNQFVETQAESETNEAVPFPVEQAGGMKDWEGNIVEKFGKLGKYGQDVLRSNPELGIGVVADGTSTGVDSYEIARRASRRAQAILEDIPLEQCTDLAMVESHLNAQLETLLQEVNQMSADTKGATTLLAVRYLEKFDAVVMIDIGDCEAVAVVDNTVESLKPSTVHSNRTDSIIKKQNGLSKLNRVTEQSFVRSVDLKSLRAQHLEAPIRILLASDGLQNNTGKTLEQQAQEIIAKGVQVIVAEAGTAKDDISILDMTIPAREVRKEAAA